MNINVQLYAAAKDAAGVSPVDVVVSDAATVAELKAVLVADYPALSPISDSLLVAVNRKFAADDTSISATDEVACFPPVSGG